MNKQSISKYLYQLRRDSGLNRTEAANSIGTTYKSILDWESGVMPNIDSLVKLAKLYKVKVDDILECGHKITEEELYDKYPIFNPYDYSKPLDRKKDYYTPHQIKLIQINNRLKELILKYRNGLLTRSEDHELRFLFEKMCVFSDFYIEEKPKNKEKNKYLCFLEILNEAKKSTHTSPSYFYEVKKNIDVSNGYAFVKPFPEYGDPKTDKYKDEQFKSLEPWEKDFQLALFQNSDVIFDPSDNVHALEDYERRFGCRFDKEKVVKKLIRYFIENGAVLNPWLLSFKVKNKIEKDTLAELEEKYIEYIKPMLIQSYDETGNYYYGYMENNEETRYLYKYEYELRSYVFERIDPYKFLELINSDEETIVDFLSSDSPNKEKEFRFKRAAVDYKMKEFYRVKKEYEEYKEKEKNDLEAIGPLEKKLKEGQFVFYEYEIEDIAERKDFNHIASMKKWKNLLSYSEYMKKRDKEKTKELINELDALSLAQIREKYFGKVIVSQDE